MGLKGFGNLNEQSAKIGKDGKLLKNLGCLLENVSRIPLAASFYPVTTPRCIDYTSVYAGV